jgi:hypothetical protein
MGDLHVDNIYLNVCSKDSAIYFPLNKADNFRVKLAKPLNLTGCWKLGLCEIHLCNIDIKKTIVKAKINKNVKRVVNDATDDDDDDDDAPVEGINVKDIPAICIDCNVCTGLIVNGIQTRTIRKVWGKKNIYKVFPIVYYVPIEKGYIDTIQFNIYTSVGTPVSFDATYGRVEMTLRLKRC